MTKKTGDTAFQEFLSGWACPAPFHVVRMRVLGAQVSANPALEPVAVVASLWPPGEQPRPATREEAEEFFATFMRYGERMREAAEAGRISFWPAGGLKDPEGAKARLMARIEEIEAGFLEGFWGGSGELSMPSAVVSAVDALSEAASMLGFLHTRIVEAADPLQALADSRDEITRTEHVAADRIADVCGWMKEAATSK